MYTSAAYRSDVAGAAIYVPISQILPTVTTWSTVTSLGQFGWDWRAALTALAADLHAQGIYSSLTLVHVLGVSVYDEEIRLPSGAPSSDTCPGSGGAALQQEWRQLGYSDQLLVSGCKTIVSDVAAAFPDKYIGLSLFPPVGSARLPQHPLARPS